jgi:hypothetical protein
MNPVFEEFNPQSTGLRQAAVPVQPRARGSMPLRRTCTAQDSLRPRRISDRSEEFFAGRFGYRYSAPAACAENCIKRSMQWKILGRLRASAGSPVRSASRGAPSFNSRIFSARSHVLLGKADWRYFVLPQADSHRLRRSATIVISMEFRSGPCACVIRSATRQAGANRTRTVTDSCKTGAHRRPVPDHETTWTPAEERKPAL